MKLIDADMLREWTTWLFKMKKYYYISAAELSEVLDKIPAIDPVRHGRWLHGKEISRDYIGDVCVCIHYEKWWCSECDYRIDEQPLWEFCPICGAKMSEVEG